jgi:DNA-binding NarL/FixJ family response regulator
MDAGMSPRHPARVFLLDDDDGFRSMVCRRLGLEDGFEVVGGANASDVGVALARVWRPDIVLLGLDGPGGRGVDLLPDLCRVGPAARIAVLSAAHPDLAMLAAVLFGGADTCLHKVEAVPQLPLLLALLLEDDGADPSEPPAAPRDRATLALHHDGQLRPPHRHTSQSDD